MSDELISRRDTMMEARPEYLNPIQKGHEEYNKAWNDAIEAYWNGLKELPSAQPDIKQAAKLLLDFVENCPGGESYLVTPDGEDLLTDWGYVADGLRLIHDWAERSRK